MSTYPQDIEFKVVREKWNEYRLSDGAILRAKLILGKVLAPPGVALEDTDVLNFQTQNMIIAYVPSKMKGTPIGRPLTPQELQDSVTDDLDFKQTREAVNEYMLPNNTIIRLRLMLTRVAKTDKFTPDGTPIYVTGTQVVPQIKFPKGFRKRKRRSSGKGKTPIV